MTLLKDGNGAAGETYGSLRSLLESSVPINVREQPYNAAGNGTTDDTAAIQAAINAAAISGLPVYVPSGTYKVTSLIYTSNLRIFGAGSRLSILKRQVASSSGVLGGVVGGIGALTAVEDLIVEDLTFDGDQANTTYGSNAAALLHAYHCKRVTVKRCRFMNGSGYGVGLQGFPTAAAGKVGPQMDVYLEKCEFLNNGYINGSPASADGIDVKDSERLTLIDCYSEGNSDKGFNLRGRYISVFGCRSKSNAIGWDINAHNSAVTDDADTYATLTGCAAISNTGAGFVATSTEDSVTRVSFVGCIAKSNGGAGIGSNDSASGTVRITVNGGHVFGHTSHGMSFSGADQLTITGVAVHSNGGDGIRLTDCAAGGSITACEVRNNTTWGIRSTGTSDKIALSANRLIGNTSGTFTLVGAGNVTNGDNVTG